MHPESAKHQFIELRAQGLSLAGISEKIGVSKRTLIDWNREHQAQIDGLRAAELEALHERLLASHEQELTRLTSFQRQIEQELATRSVKALSMEKLFRLSFQVRREIRHLCATASTGRDAGRKSTFGYNIAERNPRAAQPQPPETNGQSSPIKPNQGENIFSAPESCSHPALRDEEVDPSSLATPKSDEGGLPASQLPSGGVSSCSNSGSALADQAQPVSPVKPEHAPPCTIRAPGSEPEPPPLTNTPIHRGENDPATPATVSTVSSPPVLELTMASPSDNSKIENSPTPDPHLSTLNRSRNIASTAAILCRLCSRTARALRRGVPAVPRSTLAQDSAFANNARTVPLPSRFTVTTSNGGPDAVLNVTRYFLPSM
jgi:hypothetical protein